MDKESILLVFAMACEAAIILLLIRGRVLRTFPIFFTYLCWSLFSDLFINILRVRASQPTYYNAYLVQLVIDSIMIFALLVEVAWNVLRPIRSSLPKYSWVGIAVLVAVGALVLWPLAGMTVPDKVSDLGRTLILLERTPAILRAIFFLALAAFSQVLSIGWRDRELQIATGLGFYSIVSLAVTVAHTYQPVGASYHWLDILAGASYLVALLYWVYSFAAQPAERREFTPQMQHMLLAVAGAARSTRIGLTDSESDRNRK